MENELIVTEEMKLEEQLIEEENEKNDEQLQQMSQNAEVEEDLLEQRHKRLMHLLIKSQFYSQHLRQKIENWKAEESIVENKRKRLKKENKENSGSKNSSSQEDSGDENANTYKKPPTGSENEQMESCKKVGSVSVQECQPSLFENGTLRPYQLEGYSWLKTLYENGISGILADEMGLGKTVQCVAMLCHLILMGVTGPFLVVGPLSTLPNWIAEFRRFAPKVPTLLFHGTDKERAKKRLLFEKKFRVRGYNFRCCPVVVTSYEVAIKDVRRLKGLLWRYLIVDEGHRIKNHKCRLSRTLCSLRTQNRLILTGTPLQNNLAELWSLLHFLLPEIFDNLDVFESWFEVGSLMEEGGEERIVQQERDKQIVSTLHKILNPFLLRRLKKDVDLDIPLKKELLVYVPMTTLQVTLYKAILSKDLSALNCAKKPEEVVEYDGKGRPRRRSQRGKKDLSVLLSEDNTLEGLERYILEATKQPAPQTPLADRSNGTQKSVVNVSFRNVMMQCRKVVNHPYLLEYPLTPEGEFKIDNELLKSSGKLLVLDQVLKELHRTGHKVLVFSQMTKVLDIIEDYLTLRPQFKYFRLDGSVSLEDRSADISDFNRCEDRFLYLLSTRAGGLGINLTSADTVIIYDSDWNPQQDLQAQDRCHRIGQTRPVLILRFVAAGTVDQKIVERAAAKRKLERVIMRSDKFKSASYTQREDEEESDLFNPDDLLRLLQTSDHNRIYKPSTGDGVYTPEELKCLLDRSDLEGTRSPKSSSSKEELKGIFKTIPEAAANSLVL